MESNNATPASGKNRVVIIGAIVGVGIIAALVIVIINLLNKAPPEQPVVETSSAEVRGTVITPENAEEVLEEFREPSIDSSYTTRMNVDWTFDTSRSESNNAYVANPKSNKRTVYFDVNLSDTGQLVYSSPFIPVGEELKNFALTADLDAGSYPAVVTYHLVDDDENELTTVSVSVNLHILGA